MACRNVVRILPPDIEYPYDEWELEIFCSETGEWREGSVEFPDEKGYYYEFKPFSFAYNGKLYWLDSDSDFDSDQNDHLIVIGLDPFSDVNGKCSFIELDELLCYLQYQYFGAYGGCMRLCGMDETSLVILDLKEEEDGKLCLSKLMDYPLDQNMYPDKELCVGLLPFHPTNKEVEDEDEDVFYIFVDGDVVMYNIRTGKWSKKMVEKRLQKYSHHPFPIVLPWWPTPVPTLPQHDQQSSSSSDSMAEETSSSDSMDE
ncbi:hypothetical protein GBA52_009713 [Prunus armeniaca]|nr:hypothetical protein GBA52_009713 [Prunus armeniaca]